MKLLYGCDGEVADFVASLIPRVGERGFPSCKAIGVIRDDGALVGGFVYHNWNPEAGVIEFSGASLDPKWLTRPVLKGLFAYPFEQAGCQLLVTQNSASNTRLHRQLKAYGFNSYPIPRLFGRDEDAIVWTLTEEAWRSSRFNREKEETRCEQAQTAHSA